MENIQKFKLIDGDFSALEAREMLFDLISSKINFHNKESFSLQIRTNGDTSHSQKRVEELKQTRKKLEKIIEYAAENKLKLKISGEIEIDISK